MIESRINPANPVDIARRHWEILKMDISQCLYHLEQNLTMDLADPEYEMPEDWVYSGEAALQLAESGQTLWGHPGWVADWERLIRSPNPKTYGTH